MKNAIDQTYAESLSVMMERYEEKEKNYKRIIDSLNAKIEHLEKSVWKEAAAHHKTRCLKIKNNPAAREYIKALARIEYLEEYLERINKELASERAFRFKNF